MDTLNRPGAVSLRQAVKKFARNLSDYGLGIALEKAAAALASLVYERKVYRVYRRDVIANSLPKPRALPAGLTVELLDSRHIDLEAVCQIEQMEEWLEGKLEERLRDGGLCVVTRDGPMVAGFSLISFVRADIELVHQTRLLAVDEAWSEQITVRRQYRRHGVGTALRLRTFQELRQRGIRWLYGGTLPTNVGSLVFTRKLGFDEIEDIHYRRLLGSESLYTVKLRGGE